MHFHGFVFQYDTIYKQNTTAAEEVFVRFILEDNKSRVSGRIQARLHRPLSRCHSNAKETKLVIGLKLLSLGRPNPKISLLLRK